MRSEIQKGSDIETVLSKTEEVLKENKQHLFFIPALQYLLQLLKRDQDFSTLIIQSAFALDESQTDKISQKVTGDIKAKKVFMINTNLLAGFTATYKGKVYDGSARGYITKLGKQ